MKKALYFLFTLVVGLSLATPASAIRWKFWKRNKAESATTNQGKAHEEHAKKKGATKGLKEGQEGTNPGHSKK